MRNRIGRQAARLVVAIGLLATLAGCVVYPEYGFRPHPYGYFYR
jgi:hypothetical protein